MDNFEWDFSNLEEQEVEELKSFTYDELGIDNAIERIKTVDVEIERFKELLNQKIEQLKYITDLKIKKLEKKKEWDLFNLGSVIDADQTIKPTKTQKKKDFLSGSVIRKFATNKMVKPELSEEDIKTKYPDFKKEKLVVSLDWAEFKKTLEIKDNKVVNKNGEVIEDVKLEYVPAQTIVK